MLNFWKTIWEKRAKLTFCSSSTKTGKTSLKRNWVQTMWK